MVHRTSGLAFKVGVYVIVMTGLAVAVVFYIGFKKGLFAERVTYYVTSTTGENVERGVPVRLSGFKIGQVTDVSLENVDQVTITIRVLSKYQHWFRRDSNIILVQGGFIGTTFLKLEPGSEYSPMLKEDSVIRLTKVGGLNEIIEEAQPVIDDLKVIVSNFKGITEQMIHPDGPYQNLLENLESVSTDIRSGRGLAGYLLLDQRPVDYMDSLLAETDKAMKQINTLLAEATLRAKDIGPMMDEVTQLVAELNTFVKQLEALRMELSPAVDNVIEITDEVKRATKDLNKLRAKSEQTISLGNELLQRLKQTWPFVRRDGQGPPEEYPLP